MPSFLTLNGTGFKTECLRRIAQLLTLMDRLALLSPSLLLPRRTIRRAISAAHQIKDGLPRPQMLTGIEYVDNDSIDVGA